MPPHWVHKPSRVCRASPLLQRIQETSSSTKAWFPYWRLLPSSMYSSIASFWEVAVTTNETAPASVEIFSIFVRSGVVPARSQGSVANQLAHLLGEARRVVKACIPGSPSLPNVVEPGSAGQHRVTHPESNRRGRAGVQQPTTADTRVLMLVRAHPVAPFLRLGKSPFYSAPDFPADSCQRGADAV